MGIFDEAQLELDDEAKKASDCEKKITGAALDFCKQLKEYTDKNRIGVDVSQEGQIIKIKDGNKVLKVHVVDTDRLVLDGGAGDEVSEKDAAKKIIEWVRCR